MALLALLIVSLFICSNGEEKYDYGMVIDAGSTHSALYIYQFIDRVTSTSFAPQSSPNQIASSNDTGPIGELNNQNDCDTLIGTLIRFAKHMLATDQHRWNKFPIYLKATAGMRVLSNNDRQRILGFIATSFSNTTINPFLFDNTYAIIASGEEESTFDWLGVNYIWDKLENKDYDQHTFGALDLGGQSTQIAFAPQPSSNILAEFTAVRLWQETHRLYAHSFLQYGTNAIESRIAALCYQEMTDNLTNITHNPCLNNGVNITYNINNEINNTQFGNAGDDPFKCRALMRKLVTNQTQCYVPNCAFNGVYLAQIPSNMTFIAFSAFGYVINGLNLSQNIDLAPFYYQDTIAICNMTFEQLKESKYNTKESKNFLKTYCRVNTYIYTLLHEGYGFNETDTPIIFTNKYGESVISWTQGSILRDSNWLPYDLQHVSDNKSLNDEGRIWRASAVTAGTLFVVAFVVCLVFAGKAKKKNQSGSYQNLPK